MRRFARALRASVVCMIVAGGLLVTSAAPAAPTHYVAMSDGIQIAVNISCPHALDPPPIDMNSQVLPDSSLNCPGGGSYPVILQMSGYDGGSASGRTLLGELHDRFCPDCPEAPLSDDGRQITWPYTDSYVTVEASVRGTGCSGGEFDLFSSRSALDGYELIEWIATRPFSNGKVGLVGHSYSGLTATMIASTKPPSLTAMSVSGLIDDLYRGIVYPGGVSNYGFPLYWTGGIRPLYDVGGGTMPGLLRPLDDPADSGRSQCAGNVATHSRTVLNDPIVQGTSDTDNDWWRARSLVNHVDRVSVPIHITGAYQDEQTGGRGPAHVWEKVAGVPKRLLLTNGDHGTNVSPEEIRNDRVAWMNHWIRGIDAGHGTLADDNTSVTVLLEMRDSPRASNGRIDATSFPLESTEWTNYYLRAGGGLSTSQPGPGEGSDSYFSGSRRQGWVQPYDSPSSYEFTNASGPDQLVYATEPFSADQVIAGPIAATLFIASTAPDTELFVQVLDLGPDGETTFLQRGLLRASHRAIDPLHSDRAANGDIYRPFRPHTSPTSVTPGEIVEYLVEVWPIGHVFREDHQLAVRIAAPPAIDGIYIYVPEAPAGVNQLHHDSANLSRLLIPAVPASAVGALGAALPCGAQDSVRCVS